MKRLEYAAKWVVCWLALAMVGCPKPPPQPAPFPSLAAPPCPAGVDAEQAGLCSNAFTAEQLACVACSGAVPDGGCYLPGPAVWCVSACFDARCRVRAGAK